MKQVKQKAGRYHYITGENIPKRKVRPIEVGLMAAFYGGIGALALGVLINTVKPAIEASSEFAQSIATPESQASTQPEAIYQDVSLQETLPQEPTLQPQSALYVAGGANGTVAVSQNLQDWDRQSTGLRGMIIDVAASPMRVLAVDHFGQIAISAEGKNWKTRPNALPFNGAPVERIAWSPELHSFVAMSSKGEIGVSSTGFHWKLGTPHFLSAIEQDPESRRFYDGNQNIEVGGDMGASGFIRITDPETGTILHAGNIPNTPLRSITFRF